MKTAWMAGTASIMALLVLMGGIGVVAEADAEEASEVDEFEDLTVVEEKVQGILGGGNFIGIANRDNDAMIGVLYGTEENPNNVYVISIFTRYLGVADVYGEKGAELAQGKPIPIKTLYAQRFDTIYEFQDTDKDGIWDSRKKEEGSGNDTDSATREPVFKKVPLNTAWAASGIKKTNNGNGSLEWEVTLTAKNLPYKGPILGFPTDRQNKLEKAELTFRLYAQKKNVTKTDVPVYKVEVDKKMGNWKIDDVTAKGNRTYSGVAVSANAKYDDYIEGWDYAKKDTNHHLMLSTEILFLNAVSPKTAEWLKGEHGDKFGSGNGTATFETSIGKEKMALRGLKQGSADPILSHSAEKPKAIRKNNLGFADNWEKVGTLKWVSDVTVDGNDTQMYFQVYMGRAFAGVNAKGLMYAGFGVLGGFCYPGGQKIFHDPILQVETFTLDPGDQDESRPIIRLIFIGLVLFMGVAILVVIAVVAVGGLMAMRRKESVGSGKGKDEDYYETYYVEKRKR